MTETHIAGELHGLSAHPGDIYHRAAMTVEMLVRERDEARSRFNDIDLCRMAQSPCNALLDAEARIAELTRERDEARDGREARHRAWLEAKARNGRLEAALRDAENRLRGAGMLGGSDDPIVAAIRALKEPTP
jgi:hypothetical protein